MNRRQFLILFIVLVVLGGAGLALFWQDIASYRTSGAKIGGKLLPGFKIAEVAAIHLQDAKNQVSLAGRENGWVVEQRRGYPADAQAIGDLMLKLADLKVIQSETIGESLLPRLSLAAPGKGEGSGIHIEFKNASNKTLAGLTLGKTVLKKDPLNPLPSAVNGVPAGRYIRVAGAGDTVVVVSDPLAGAEAGPGKWLNKDFFKVKRIKTLALGSEGALPEWKILRNEEWGPWKFSDGGQLDSRAAESAVNALDQIAFEDVAVEAGSQGMEKARLVVAETFDNLTYRLRITKAKSGDDYDLSFAVSGQPRKNRVPEKGEKPEDKAQRDKEFAESIRMLEQRIVHEKALAKWTYVVAGKTLAPLLRSRTQMTASLGKP